MQIDSKSETLANGKMGGERKMANGQKYLIFFRPFRSQTWNMQMQCFFYA